MCGPGPFMDAVHKALAEAGMPRTQVHAEVFNSLAGDPFRDVEVAEVTDEEAADAATVEVELDGETHTLVWPRKQTLVDIMLAKGLDVPYSCQEGECGSCACTVPKAKCRWTTPRSSTPRTSRTATSSVARRSRSPTTSRSSSDRRHYPPLGTLPLDAPSRRPRRYPARASASRCSVA